MHDNAEQAVEAVTAVTFPALGGCSAVDLAREFGTPLLVIDEMLLRGNMRRMRAAFGRHGWSAGVTYAGKALLTTAIALIAHEEGLDIDVCSRGELETVLRAGVPGARCLIHGCNKSRDELAAGVAAGARFIVIDHEMEIAELAGIAARQGIRCSVLLRVNPAISAVEDERVRTGTSDSKFGLPIEDGQALAAVKRILNSDSLKFAGLHCHLGSQIADVTPFEAAVGVLVEFAQTIRRECGVETAALDLGGGLACADSRESKASPEAWADCIFDALERKTAEHELPRPQILVEPGRSIVGPAGSTLYRIGVRKRLADGSRALIVDGGLSDNPRPALYAARYRVEVAERQQHPPDGRYTVFGKHCEPDLLFAGVPLADPQPGDVLIVRETGAYTYSMAGNYNRFPRPAIVLACAGSARPIARRESLQDVLELDVASGEFSPV